MGERSKRKSIETSSHLFVEGGDALRFFWVLCLKTYLVDKKDSFWYKYKPTLLFWASKKIFLLLPAFFDIFSGLQKRICDCHADFFGVTLRYAEFVAPIKFAFFFLVSICKLVKYGFKFPVFFVL